MRPWLIVAAALVAAPLAVLLAIAAFGVPVSAAPWRDGIGAVASTALGRQVTLEGPLELVLGLRTGLRVGGIRIANPPGFATPAFAELGAARAEVDLWPVLRGRLRIRTLEATNVKVWLERSADGRRNWVFDALSDEPEPDDEGSGVAVRIGQMTLRDLAVEHHARGRVRYFDLDTLDAEGAWRRPVKAVVRGRVEKQFPYLLTLEGGPGRHFYRGDEPWPFTLDLAFAGTRMHASGTADTSAGAADVFVGLGTDNLGEIERLLQTRLPKIGVTSFAAHVTARGDQVTLSRHPRRHGRVRVRRAPRSRVSGRTAARHRRTRCVDVRPAAVPRRRRRAVRRRAGTHSSANGSTSAASPWPIPTCGCASPAGWGCPGTCAMRSSNCASRTASSARRSKRRSPGCRSPGGSISTARRPCRRSRWSSARERRRSAGSRRC